MRFHKSLRRRIDAAVTDRLKAVAWRAAAFLYSVRLRRAARRAHNLDDHLDVAFGSRLGPLRIQPMQIRSEVRRLLVLLSEHRPHGVVEIGTARGGTLYLLSQVATPDATVVSVDLPGGPFGRGYPPWKETLYRAFAQPRQTLSLLRGDSRAPEMIDAVRQRLPSGGADFLLIDGDHSYDGVAADFANYSPFVQDGWIAFHDIRPASERRVGGVPQFWQEVRQRYLSEELLAEGDHDGFGIGLLRIRKDGDQG